MGKICRICLNSTISEEALSIYEKYENEKEIYLKIMDLSGILIDQKDKSMPNSICKQCYEKLNSSYQFKNLCRDSDEQLKREVNIIADKYDSDSEIHFDYAELCKIEVDEEAERIIKNTEKELSQPKLDLNVNSTFKLISGSNSASTKQFLCKVCGTKVSVRNGKMKYVFNRHLETKNHRYYELLIDKESNNETVTVVKVENKFSFEANSTIIATTAENKLSCEENSRIVTEPENKVPRKDNLSIIADSNKAENKFSCEPNSSIIDTEAESSSIITVKTKTMASTKTVCKICGGKFNMRKKCDLNRHNNTEIHRYHLDKLKKSNTENILPGEEDLSINPEITKNPIIRFTETAIGSKRKNTIFNIKLQEEFKADFEPDKNCKFNAFCKTCQRTISIKSSGRMNLVHHLNTYRHKGINLTKLKSDNKTIDDLMLKDQMHICEICGNVFNNIYLLRKHVTLHNETFSIPCTICHKKFRRTEHVKRHMLLHTGERPYQCSYCDRCFRDLSTKAKHERTHTDEKPYPCHTCMKRFRTASLRNGHERIHSVERPFRCGTCGIGFNKKCYLKSHYKTMAHQNQLPDYCNM